MALLWSDPEWRAKRIQAMRDAGACAKNHDFVRDWAAQGLSTCEIGRRIGTTHNKVRAYIERHNLLYTYHHYQGENNPSWKGGRTTDKDGYILILKPDHPHANRHGYVREHRIVMEQVLGRYLERNEVVHHIDEVRHHNDPSNLKLFQSNGQHLAETLHGRCPDWTPEGKVRLAATARQRKRKKALSIQIPQKTDAPQSQ